MPIVTNASETLKGKRKVCLCDSAVDLLDQSITHRDYTTASTFHGSSLILCWFPHLFLIFFPPLSYAPHYFIKPSCGIFHVTSSDSSSHCLKWHEPLRHIVASMWALKHYPTQPFSEVAGAGVFWRRWTSSWVRPRPPRSPPIWDVEMSGARLWRVSFLEAKRLGSWPALAPPSSLFVVTRDNISMVGTVASCGNTQWRHAWPEAKFWLG